MTRQRQRKGKKGLAKRVASLDFCSTHFCLASSVDSPLVSHLVSQESFFKYHRYIWYTTNKWRGCMATKGGVTF